MDPDKLGLTAGRKPCHVPRCGDDWWRSDAAVRHWRCCCGGNTPAVDLHLHDRCATPSLPRMFHQARRVCHGRTMQSFGMAWPGWAQVQLHYRACVQDKRRLLGLACSMPSTLAGSILRTGASPSKSAGSLRCQLGRVLVCSSPGFLLTGFTFGRMCWSPIARRTTTGCATVCRVSEPAFFRVRRRCRNREICRETSGAALTC